MGRQAENELEKVLYLKDFDLTGGRMEVLHVFSIFTGGKHVHLDMERHPIRPTMLLLGKLSADAVHLRKEELKNEVSKSRKITDFRQMTKDKNLSVPGRKLRRS